MSFHDRIDHYLERVTRKLDAVLPSEKERPERLHEAMRYAVFNGGKRVRPLLVYASGECLAVDEHALDAPAAAIELIHAFSLVHDDLPAMDDDDLRRGKPTVHRQFDEATAILAADALQPLAFAVLADIDGVPADIRARMVRLVADACGSIGMTGGQSIDLAAEGQILEIDELENMYAQKTGALIHASVMSACLLRSDLPSMHFPGLSASHSRSAMTFSILRGRPRSLANLPAPTQRLPRRLTRANSASRWHASAALTCSKALLQNSRYSVIAPTRCAGWHATLLSARTSQ